MEEPFLLREDAVWPPRVGGGGVAYKASAWRFYVLFVLSVFSCMQCACWFVFFVELAAELVPVTETTSNGVLVLVWNATSCVLLALPTALLGEQTMNYAFLAVLAAAAGLVGLVVDEVHCRPTDADAQETRIGHLQETGSDVSTTF